MIPAMDPVSYLLLGLIPVYTFRAITRLIRGKLEKLQAPDHSAVGTSIGEEVVHGNEQTADRGLGSVRKIRGEQEHPEGLAHKDYAHLGQP